MITFSLQSGSNGNCIYVEAGEARLLFDAGISGKNAEGRMRVHDCPTCGIDALLISHDHNDHVRGAGVFHRKFGVPIWMTRTTHAAVRCNLGQLTGMNYFKSGQTLQFKDALVHTIPTPHDAADGVGFIVEHAGKRLGILTDLGHPFPALQEIMCSLDAVYLESNYDPEMLRNGSYPQELQDRISGPHGHLSNDDAADLLCCASKRLQWVALSHLSQDNNTPELALKTHRKKLGRQFPFFLAPRHHASEIMSL